MQAETRQPHGLDRRGEQKAPCDELERAGNPLWAAVRTPMVGGIVETRREDLQRRLVLELADSQSLHSTPLWGEKETQGL